MVRVYVVFKKIFVGKDNRHENHLITVFSDYDIASGFCKTLTKRAKDGEEFLIAGLAWTNTC